MVDFLRKLVSGERRRFEDEANNVNLDLSYITSRIIAMSYPSDGLEGYYRNPIEKVRMMQINFRCPSFLTKGMEIDTGLSMSLKELPTTKQSFLGTEQVNITGRTITDRLSVTFLK